MKAWPTVQGSTYGDAEAAVKVEQSEAEDDFSSPPPHPNAATTRQAHSPRVRAAMGVSEAVRAEKRRDAEIGVVDVDFLVLQSQAEMFVDRELESAAVQQVFVARGFGNADGALRNRGVRIVEHVAELHVRREVFVERPPAECRGEEAVVLHPHAQRAVVIIQRAAVDVTAFRSEKAVERIPAEQLEGRISSREPHGTLFGHAETGAEIEPRILRS